MPAICDSYKITNKNREDTKWRVLRYFYICVDRSRELPEEKMTPLTGYMLLYTRHYPGTLTSV